jgi:hypothetical protein
VNNLTITGAKEKAAALFTHGALVYAGGVLVANGFVITRVPVGKLPDEVRDDYSGKQRRHTHKQLVMDTRSGLIVDQSPSVGGLTHDFKACKANHAKRGIYQEFAGLRVTL